MPTPVSSFSPFTPFTPASATHGSGGYFDRPTPNIVSAASPLARRPDLCPSTYSSSSSTRVSRFSAPIDPPRQAAENGWRAASRLRDEALSAWEQQVRSNINPNNITLLCDPRQSSPKSTPGYTQHGAENLPDKSRPTSAERAKQVSNPSRPSLRLALHFHQGPSQVCSESLIEKPAGHFQKTSKSFNDPLSLSITQYTPTSKIER